MQKRQKNELHEFRKRLEQKKNDKQSKEAKRSVTPNMSTAIPKTTTTTTTTTTVIAQTQTVGEHRAANGHSVKSICKKQILHSDENLKRFQERSMQQFAYDALKKKGGGGGWSASKHGFNQLKNPSGVGPGQGAAKGPRASTPTPGTTPMAPIPSGQGLIAHPTPAMVFANPQSASGNMHSSIGQPQGQPHHQWPSPAENAPSYWPNQRGQQMNFPDGGVGGGGSGGGGATAAGGGGNRPATNGAAHIRGAVSQQNTQMNVPPRTNCAMSTDTKHVVLPSR